MSNAPIAGADSLRTIKKSVTGGTCIDFQSEIAWAELFGIRTGARSCAEERPTLGIKAIETSNTIPTITLCQEGSLSHARQV